MHDKSTKQQLLDASIDWVAAHGLGDLSMRQLAAALGTSHRMLIFHFGSKEKLWIEIVRTVEERQREQLRAQLPSADKPVGEAIWTWWKHISDPSLWANERLFFELYGQALQGRPHAVDFLDGIVEDWVEPVAAASIARGVPEVLAHAQARLGVAVARGLLLDLLATGDTDAVDRAMAAFIELCETWIRHAGRDLADEDLQ
ncbi:MAG: TetR/AcrR family transcriptional regulator [Solirubrobacteraceae bacterium]